MPARTQRTPVLDHPHHFRNHVASTAHDDAVAHAHVQARNLIGVVQGGAGHGDAAHVHRRHQHPRGDRAGAADVDLDRFDRGRGFLRGELVGNGPARRTRNEAHGALLVEAVQLVDHAVDVVRQGVALAADLAVIRQQAFDPDRDTDQRTHRETERA